jgi:pentatricopeptide repeat protein
MLMAACVEGRRWREGAKLLGLMRAYKVTPDDESYSWAITAFVAMGDMQEATRLLGEMSDLGLAPSRDIISRWSSLTGEQDQQGAALHGGASTAFS